MWFFFVVWFCFLFSSYTSTCTGKGIKYAFKLFEFQNKFQIYSNEKWKQTWLYNDLYKEPKKKYLLQNRFKTISAFTKRWWWKSHKCNHYSAVNLLENVLPQVRVNRRIKDFFILQKCARKFDCLYRINRTHGACRLTTLVEFKFNDSLPHVPRWFWMKKK